MSAAKPHLFMSVDLDSWLHCRWATGGPHAIWPDSLTAYREIYGQDRPGDDFHEGCEWVLDAFRRHDVSATFFILAEVATLFPELVRRIRDEGYEVALHGMYHVDNTRYSIEEFRSMIRQSRAILEEILGHPVVGYRAANLILSSAQLEVLDDEGFLYDSSVCPTGRFLGKYANMAGAPTAPYRPARDDLSRRGDLRIVELPHGTFPVVNLPVSTGVMTRVLGAWWAYLGLARALRRGYGLYYFHPYEVGPPIAAPRESRYIRLFLRNVGRPYRRSLEWLIPRLLERAEFVQGRRLAEMLR